MDSRPSNPSEPGAVEFIWALFLSSAVAQFAGIVFLSSMHSGLGLMVVGGEYLAGQGRARLPISQALGSTWHFLQVGFLTAAPVALVFSVWVFARQGALQPSKIFASSTWLSRVALTCWRAALVLAVGAWAGMYIALLKALF